MNAASHQASAGPSVALRMALADDLLALSRLHARELDWELITSLQRRSLGDMLELHLRGEQALNALALMRAGLRMIPTALREYTRRRLDADYANIYLTHRTPGAPCESVWLDQERPDGHDCAFRVRQWYRTHGLPAADRCPLHDDHLANELRFLAHLLRGPPAAVPLAVALRFMDEHPLRWVREFAQGVATGCDTRFYAGLALLTAAYLDELRALLTTLQEQPRPLADASDLPRDQPHPCRVAGPAPATRARAQ